MIILTKAMGVLMLSFPVYAASLFFFLASSTFMLLCHADNFDKCRKWGWLILLLFPSLDPGYFSF